MRSNCRCLAIVLAVSLGLASLAPGQDKRNFFKPPETAQEFWRAIQFEINVGQYDLAAEYLKGFLAKNPTDEELLQIQEQEGSSAFLRLLTIPQLREQAKPLVERVDAVVQKYLSDPKRLDRFIRDLSASSEDRAYAIAQLRRSGAAAMPALIEGILRTADNPPEHSAILTALPRLHRDIVPPLVAALDMSNVTVRAELLDVLSQRQAMEAAPSLWYLAGSPKQPELIRKKAAALLGAFLDLPPDKLPPARVALTREAEQYYQHRVKFANPEAVRVWRWDGKGLLSQDVPASQAEEYYGLRFARQALDIDPSYQPAQIVFLSLALEKGYQRAGLDQPLGKGAPEVKELLRSINPDLVTAVLERALDEKRLAVILGAVHALGDLAEVRAARPSGHGTPALIRALNYPDRRVQLAAADALLRIPGSPGSSASTRIVEVLRRAVAADAQPRVLIGDSNADRGKAIAAAVQKAGFEPVFVGTGREVLRRLNEAADIDALLIDAALPDPGLPYLLAQLRADVNAGLLPVILMAPADRLMAVTRLAEPYRHVWVMMPTTDVDALKNTLAARIAETIGQPYSEAERKNATSEALLALARLARGEVPGHDIRPAEAAVLKALRSDELANTAIEVAGRLPGQAVQRELAAYVLDGARPAPLRSKAAIELCRHIQQNGMVLTREQIQGLEALFEMLDDPQLKANVALVIGAVRPTAKQTGERLGRYNPPLAAPAKPAAPTEEPKEKEKEKEK